MKKTILSLLILGSTTFLFVFSAYAQKQRLGIVPQEIILDGGKTSANVEAFCFDRHIIIDASYDYKYLQTDESAVRVVVGDKNYSLSEAIKQKVIKVTGRPGVKNEPDLVIEITKLVPETVLVKVEKASVFRDTPGTYKNQKALNVLNSIEPSGGQRRVNSQAIQDTVWMADVDRARLESLGYKSIEEFQRKNNLPETNTFDARTSTKLEAEERALIKRFEDVGLDGSRSETSVQSVSDYIRLFEKKAGIKETGIFNSEVRSLFEKFEPGAKVDFANTRELYQFSQDSVATVWRVKSSVGGENFYSLYSSYGKLYEGNDISEITRIVAERADYLKALGLKFYLDLDFPSAEKGIALKTSLRLSDLTFIEAQSEAKIAFFTSRQPVEIISTTNPTLSRGEWSQDINLNANRKITAIAKVKSVVVKFVGTFRSLIGENQSLAYIVNQSREASGSLKVIFTDQYRKSHVVELFRNELPEVNAE